MTSMAGLVNTPSRTRLRSLDGLRGAAALVVVAHHVLLVLPVMVGIQETGSAAGGPWWLWAMTHTPLHILWAGEEAVVVFFVLSGYVLALPALGRKPSWRSYYPRRLLRLYIPVWGSLALAVTYYLLLPRNNADDHSDWLAGHVDIPLTDAAKDLHLFTGASQFNTPLWSLQWEIAFSLLLPLYLLLARPSRRWLPVIIAGLLALVGVGIVLHNPAMHYLPVFAIGVLLAAHADGLKRLAEILTNRHRARLWWGALAAVTVVLLTARWEASGIAPDSAVLNAMASGAVLVGAALAVELAQHWPAARTALETTPSRWLGDRSFSLYLTHEPVLVAVAFLLPAAAAAWAGILAIPCALVVAAGFYLVVERPSHLASRAVGLWANRRGGKDRS